jgi:hypothetical protein
LDKELDNIKLTLRADYLLSSRHKNLHVKPVNEISFKNVILGRKILEMSNFECKTKGLMEISMKKMIESIKFVKEMYENDEFEDIALKSPFHYYDTVRVCPRCYSIYSLFTIQFKPTEKVEFEEKEEKITKEIDTNNLNDLLADIQKVKFFMKHGQERQQFVELSNCSWNNTMNKETSPPQSPSPKYGKRATIDIRKNEDIDYERLTRMIFPDARIRLEEKKRGRGGIKREKV